jgi:DNA-binding LytR/AlgR family response regulator
MKYSCIIIDDEPLSHKVLKNHIGKIPNLEVKNSFYNAIDAHNWLNQESVDIILLDIQMPELTGLDFLRSLKIKPLTILTTAFRDYAIEGFELGVVDYLLKPIQFNRLDIAIQRAIDFLRLSKTGATIDFSTAKTNRNFELLIKTGTAKVLLDYRSITYAQGLKDYTILHTREKKYVVKGSVKTFEDFLPAEFFMRVHKSFIVAREKIRIVHKGRIEFENTYVPIGRNYKAAVDAYLQSPTGSSDK